MPAEPDNLLARWLKGVLESCVLGILRSGPAYGYDIAGRIAEAGFARPKGGTLYPILSRLETEGLVEATWIEGDGGPSRKYYELTPAGLDAVDAVATRWPAFATSVETLLSTHPARRN